MADPMWGYLDAEELTQLALLELQREQPAHALALLKLATAGGSAHGRTHYLLGALRAGLGLVERGIQDMRRAVELAPSLHEAHFHLGLLELNRGQLEEARKAWKPLADLPKESAVARCMTGMLEVAEGRLQEGIATLEAGIAAAGGNESLTRGMRQVIETAREALERSSDSAAAETPRRAPRDLLSRYESMGGEPVRSA